MTSRCQPVPADNPLALLREVRSALIGARGPLMPVRAEDADRVLGSLDLTVPVPDGIAAVVATSGSTGVPKAAMLPAAAMLASADATLARLGGPGQWLLALPASSVAGLQVLTRSAVAGTIPVVARGTGPADVRNAVDRMDGVRRYGAFVPTQLRRALQDPHAAAALASLDALLLGAAAADDALLRDAADAGVRVVTTYGMTETCGGCVYDREPLDGVRVRVTHADDTPVGGPGRIELAGPTLFAGYLARRDLTNDVLRDGWLRTNDLGDLDTTGRLTVTGRSDDVVISGGVNIALPRLRARLVEHPDVEDAACVGVPDPDWGTSVVAFVVPHAGARIDRGTVRSWLGDVLGRAYVPRHVATVTALPMLPNGKVDMSGLRERAAAMSED